MTTSDSSAQKPTARKPAAKKANGSTASTPESTARTPSEAATVSASAAGRAPTEPPAPPLAGQGLMAPAAPQPGASTSASYGSPQPMLEQDARTFAMLTHLSPLLLNASGLGWVGTLIFYLIYKDRSLLVREHGREELNLQISTLIWVVAAFVLSLPTLGLSFVALAAMVLVAFILQIIAAVKAYNGEYYHYGIAFPFIR